MAAANLGLRFALELCMLAAFGYWGAGAGHGRAWHVALAVAAPAVVAVIWAIALAPRAVVRLPRPAWIVLQLILFGLAGAALAASGRAALGLAFGLLAAANLAVLLALHAADGR